MQYYYLYMLILDFFFFQNFSLSGCLITKYGGESLVLALRSNPSHLRNLDLSYNHPGDSYVEELSKGLKNTQWRLDNLRYEQEFTCHWFI